MILSKYHNSSSTKFNKRKTRKMPNKAVEVTSNLQEDVKKQMSDLRKQTRITIRSQQYKGDSQLWIKPQKEKKFCKEIEIRGNL